MDESSGLPLAERLRQEGHDVVFSPEWKISADDEEICDKAYSEGRIVVTDDKGFGELVFKRRRPAVGVLLLRWRGRDYERLVEAVAEAVAEHGDKFERKFSVMDFGCVRIRPLPPGQ